MVRCIQVTIICVIMLLCVNVTIVFAQVPDTMWTQTYGDTTYQTGYSVSPTFDGGYIIAGETGYRAGQTPRNAWLLKTDQNGDTIWTKTYGGTEEDRAYCAVQTDDSCYAVVGYSLSYSASPSFEDVWFFKTDINGDTLWAYTIDGGPIHDRADRGLCLQQTIDNGFIISGYTCNDGGFADVFLVKTDTAGTVEWTQTYGEETRVEYGMAVEQTSDSGYIIGGFGHQFGSDFRVWILKTDYAGDTTWTTTYGSPGYTDCFSIQQTSDGGYIFTGETSYGAGGRDLWLFKTDANGDSLWAKVYGGPENDYGLAVRQTTDNGYIITGSTQCYGSGRDVWLLKTDADGDTLWTRIWGGALNEVGISVEQTPDFGYIITGRRQIDSDNHDLWLLKVEPDLSITENGSTCPPEFSILQISPNPFRHFTDIRCQITDNCNETVLMVYDIEGRKIKDLTEGLSAASHQSTVKWSGTDNFNRILPSGVYFLKLMAGDYAVTRKLLLIR
ncbi:MAG: T9SS type A sorting domain-containing protein [bacterium]